LTLAALFLVLAAIPAPEECVVVKGETPVWLVWSGKTYYFHHEDCRTEFLTDPERYGQLYDALIELASEGTALEAPQPSLVPS
jgi:YHS domain-containing protein